MKTRTNISIDPYLLEEARKKRINVSEVTEESIKKRLHPLAEADIEPKEYPFEICATEIDEHIRSILFACSAIKAKRCKSCGRIFFVNDLAGEFTICRDCFNKKMNNLGGFK